jgi:hypothetical protein
VIATVVRPSQQKLLIDVSPPCRWPRTCRGDGAAARRRATQYGGITVEVLNTDAEDG